MPHIFGFLNLHFILFFFILLFVFASAVKIVPESQEWTLERFGKFMRLLQPGFHIIIPIIDRVGKKVSLRERVLDIPLQNIITKDNVMVTVDGVVFYRVFDTVKAAYKVQHIHLSITQLTWTNIRTVMGDMELDSLLSNREVINAKLLKVIDKATDPWGIKVIRIEIKDIQPPKDIQEAMGKQMKAEREKRAAILNSQASREATVTVARGEREAAILIAEGKKQAVMLNAEAEKQKTILEAEAQERKAQAEAFSLETIGKNSSEQARSYLLSKDSIKSLRTLASADNQRVLVVPFESSNIIGALAGLTTAGKELLSGAKGKSNSEKNKKM